MAPELLLEREECSALALTVSDQEATILFRTNENNIVIQSLLKLTVLPIHTNVLAPSADIRGLEPNDLDAAFSSSESHRIKDFLSSFSFCLSSESGAEYSYYDVTPKSRPRQPILNPISDNHFMTHPVFRVEFIHPASERQIQRALPVPAYVMVEESPRLYENVVAPFIESAIVSDTLAWIQNVLNGTKEAERLLLDTPDYILNIDTKWKSHPDPCSVPKHEWKTNQTALEDLNCLAIVKCEGLKSIRDLRSESIPMLQDMLVQCPKVIQEVYGVRNNQLRIFIHYHPQFYRLHVHFTRIGNEVGCLVERAHLLSDVIQNLQMDGNYYSQRTITYKLRTNEALFKLIQSGSGL